MRAIYADVSPPVPGRPLSSPAADLMASKTLRNPPRPKDQPILAKPKTKRIDNPKGSDLCSLFIVIAVPLSLSLAIIHLFGSGRRYRALAKPFWFPSLTAIHLGSVGSTFLTSLAAWLVWTGGGFRIDSDALPLYLAQISLSMVWDPLVLRIGAVWLGFLLSVLNLGTLFACYRAFGKVNPLSRKFVEPCLAWVAYLTLVTFDLVYL